MARRNGDYISVRVEGDKEIRAKLKNLEDKVARKISRSAITKAATPVLKSARKNAPLGAGLRPGGQERIHLRKALMKKVRTYKRSGNVVAMIGPKSGSAPHGHLVEDDTQPHDIVLTKPLVLGNVVLPAGFVIKHPGTSAQKFLERALEENKAKYNQIMRTEILKGIEKEAKKSA